MLPDYFNLENQRSKLIEHTMNTSSGIIRFFHFYKYFSIILECRDQNIEEAFLKEFIDDYLLSLSKFEIWGIDPEFTNRLITHLEVLNHSSVMTNNAEALRQIVQRLENEVKKLLLVLDGKEIEEDSERKAYFPLIDKDNTDGFYGIIDSATVKN